MYIKLPPQPFGRYASFGKGARVAVDLEPKRLRVEAAGKEVLVGELYREIKVRSGIQLVRARFLFLLLCVIANECLYFTRILAISMKQFIEMDFLKKLSFSMSLFRHHFILFVY